MEIEIGRAKRGRRAYSFDDLAIVPSRRTRDPEEVSTAWQIDAYRFELPIIAAPMDSVMSPETAIALGRHGGLGVLNLEGLWTRYEDPTDLMADIARLDAGTVVRRMQEMYAEPVRAELIAARLEQMRASGVTVAGSLSPQRTKEFAKTVVDAGVDMFVIRGTTVSAEHASARTPGGAAAEPQGVHLRARRPGDRGRVCDVPGRSALDAHRRCRCAGRLRRRSSPHQPHRAGRLRAHGECGRRRGGGETRIH